VLLLQKKIGGSTLTTLHNFDLTFLNNQTQVDRTRYNAFGVAARNDIIIAGRESKVP
jgi:hypothetical protein